MKICINALILKKNNTGIGVYARCLLEELVQNRDCNFIIFVPDAAFLPLSAPNVRLVELRTAKKNTLGRILTEQLLLPFYVKKINPDVLHSLSFVMPFGARRVLQFVTVHDMFHEVCAFTIPPLKRLYYAFFFNRSIRKADGIFAVSEQTKNDVVRLLNVPPEKIAVTPLGVRSEFLRFIEAAELSAAFINFKLPQKYALFIGGLEPRKNLAKLLEAFSLVRDKTALKLLVTGVAGRQKKDLDSQIAACGLQGTVLYTGYLEERELSCVYAAALMLIMPSLYEGFGLPVIEAMSAGTPVITSDNSSLSEIADGAALLVNPLDADELARAILELANNAALRIKLIEKGFEQVKKYTWRLTASATMKQYQVFRKGQ